MSDIAIKVENLGKSYMVGHNAAQAEHYTALRDVMARNVKNLARKTRDMLMGRPIVHGDDVEEFWALKDVNFEIKQGERVGIIGRNGAGKSTLLKILSRITEPTAGRVTLNGRVASLLEVGTGFHPELTGRENIYLNGAILGMSQAEVRRSFDEIVAFAEIEMFLDTPVKRYSSGMYMRLAFAVAAHLLSEILIVDEVLAVGDVSFQKKCLKKMEDAGDNGRTVIFVSHNMDAVQRLCDSAIILKKGRVALHTKNVPQAMHDYFFEDGRNGGHSSCWVNESGEYSNQWCIPIKFRVCDSSFETLAGVNSNNNDLWVEILVDVLYQDPALTIGYALYSENGDLLYWSYPTDAKKEIIPLPKGLRTLRTKIPGGLLNEGVYRVEIIGGLHNRQWLFEPGISAPQIFFEIKGRLSESPYWLSRRPGCLAPVFQWIEL